MTLATTFTQIPTDKIVPSPYQYRKTFGGAEDDDLAESVRKHGVLQPVRVRPNGKPGMFELVFGERRWRAAKAAELADVPAIVVELGDDDVIEQLLVENLKRRDVHPLEEGEGYQRLLDKYGYTIDQLVSKTGKSKAHLYGRMKLTELTPSAKKALLAGHLQAMVAELIARIPNAKLQDAAVKDVLGQTHEYDGIEPECIPGENHKREYQPLSYRAAAALIRKKYSLRLELAKFDPADATLTKVGACTTCQHRSGNQPELPGIDGGKSSAVDLCTNPPCFEEKKKAAFERVAADATRAGMRVLNKKENDNVFEHWNQTSVSSSSAYVDPKANLPYDLDPSGKKTWEKVLGKDEPAKVLALDGNGAPRILLDKKSVLAKLEKAGKLDELKAEAKLKSRSTGNEYSDQRKKQEAENKRRHRVARLAFAKISEKAKNATGMKFWHWLALGILKMSDSEDQRNLCRRREIETKLGNGDAEKALKKVVEETKTVDDALAMVVEFVAAHRAVGGMFAGQGYGENFRGACDIFGVDLDKLKKQVVEEDKAKKTAKKAKKGASKK